jgi:hypothetical protein
MVNRLLTEKKAPKGKTRVIVIDTFEQLDYLVGDYDSPEEAFSAVDESKNARPGFINDLYCVYDDQGRLIRDDSAVGQGPSS